MKRLTGLFQEWGLTPGDRLLIGCGDDGAVVTVVLACLACGLSAVIVDHSATAREADSLIEHVQPDAAVIDESLRTVWPLARLPKILPVSSGIRNQGALFRKVFRKIKKEVEEQPISYPQIIESYEPSASTYGLSDEAEAYVLFTSGTTSKPKGVCISRKSLLVHSQTLSKQWGYTQESRILNILPLSHADGLVQGPIIAWLNLATCIRPMQFSVTALGESF